MSGPADRPRDAASLPGTTDEIVQPAPKEEASRQGSGRGDTVDDDPVTPPGPGPVTLNALADGEDADEHFRRALAAHASSPRRPDRARTELAFGEHLRRGRHRVEARTHLRAALTLFEDLGAVTWGERAAAELRASGETARRRDVSTTTDLTPQERQVAALVRQGLTNRDVAAQLFISPRTVDFHLRGCFAKLGVTSRVELAALPLDV